MFLSPAEIIRKKRDGHALSREELAAFFALYLKDQIKDYQVSALLMAITLKGMDEEETADLTKIMRDSGRVLRWDFPKPGTVVDKHSTGGIGDKTSLIILPLCILEGLKVPMISGRGLGHTGGTLDKLEAIPGVNVRPEMRVIENLMQKLGGVFMGQSEDLAPLDKRLYALRDVTGTVESIPLITASILSKKACEGLDGLVMDVKFGSGAFIRDYEQALLLAKTISKVAKGCGMKVRCLLTDMNSPLGRNAGHNLEILECLEIFKGEGPEDTRDLTLELSAEMVKLAFPERSLDQIKKALVAHLKSGAAFDLFCQIIAAQGGDISYLKNPAKFQAAKFQKEIFATAKNANFVTAIDVRKLGLAIVALGGGRKLTTDPIDPTVGLTAMKHVGEKVGDEPLLVIHANDKDGLAEAERIVLEAYACGKQATSYPLIRERL